MRFSSLKEVSLRLLGVVKPENYKFAFKILYQSKHTVYSLDNLSSGEARPMYQANGIEAYLLNRYLVEYRIHLPCFYIPALINEVFLL